MKSSFTSEAGISKVPFSAAKEFAKVPAADSRSESDLAKRRIEHSKGDPFLFADWEQVMFLHFVVAPEVLQPLVPAPLELDLFQGTACLTLVALTMRDFRPGRPGFAGCLLRPISQQRFLNLRTYVRLGNEPGALFLWGWLSRPWRAHLPSELFSLPYNFASMEYDHRAHAGKFHGLVAEGTKRFTYTATASPGIARLQCAPHSLAEFAMERYSGFFCRKHEALVFRTWHPSWTQIPTNASIEDDSLITSKFPWFKKAIFNSANFAEGFEHVWLGRAHKLSEPRLNRPSRHVLSSFYEMP